MGVDGGGDILVSRVENVSCAWKSEKNIYNCSILLFLLAYLA